MKTIVTVQDAVTAFADWIEPTNAELDAIEQEIPAILAEVDLVDAQIIALNHMPNEVDAKRVRRAFGKVLEERRALANRTADATVTGGAA
ncbi:DUF6284 family protein [Streptomyces europaeiscabiei]|uniref:DUF6284 family protein n=1 Tax=Streptomyces europaeiscabiei TaxID=146819 RepID=A0ABU4NX55_9ACTN|nr:DUF6284 family protein [Streptomyces europaeiscabiei]MDX3549660.1 DUF6284 family protein [Streptomyces europaeiscabiei]MDX3557971.1 DUF6284 family protein [Streptomyces europaeiscabiei]MDX3706949.1 DUF6284 family protein [Streptomyces europaeiscabiei]